MDQRIYKYLEDIVATAHGQTMPPALKDKIISDLAIQLEQKITTALLEHLSPAQQTDYNTLIGQQPNNEAVMAWFEQRLPQTPEIIKAVLEHFEADYVSYMKS